VNGMFGNSVVYSTLERADLALTYAHPRKPLGMTAEFQRRYWRNDAQGVENRLNSGSWTGWWTSPNGKTTATRATC